MNKKADSHHNELYPRINQARFPIGPARVLIATALARLIATAGRIRELDTIIQHHRHNEDTKYRRLLNPAINHRQIGRMQNRATMRVKRNTLSMRVGNNGAQFRSRIMLP